MIFLKKAQIIIKSSVCVLLFIISLIFASIIYVDSSVSADYLINKGESLEINSLVPIRVSYSASEETPADSNRGSGATFDMDVRVLGVIPAKKISVRVVDENYVAVLGTPFGIKLYTEGVLVAGFSDVETKSKDKSPAKSAGIKEGDFLVSLNGVKVYTNEDVSKIIKNSNGEIVVAEIIRNGKEKTISFYPAKSKKDGEYKAGMWVKDSSAGIGTMTFYSPKYNVVAGLGHGICDSDTGTLMSLSSGEFVSATIMSYKKGIAGEAGELNGSFTGKKLADFYCNSSNGVYGKVTCDISLDNMFEIALKQEVRNGNAYIITTINGETPEYYSCKIKIRNKGETQNLLVEITDDRLLKATGGIVQGMSGSPIIQSGKLIGAVTHVLIDDPIKGYGIFAENMLETAQGVAEGNKFKEAS